MHRFGGSWNMLLLLYLGRALSCCLRNQADDSQSELRTEGRTRIRVMPFSTLADESGELHAAVLYHWLSLPCLVMAKVGLSWACACVFHIWEEGFCVFVFLFWLKKEQTKKRSFDSFWRLRKESGKTLNQFGVEMSSLDFQRSVFQIGWSQSCLAWIRPRCPSLGQFRSVILHVMNYFTVCICEGYLTTGAGQPVSELLWGRAPSATWKLFQGLRIAE